MSSPEGADQTAQAKADAQTATESESPLGRNYWCFISYRHADNKEEGRQWATWLHQQLETYEVPDDLAGTKNATGQEIPSRIFPVFRDEEKLGAGANLSQRIHHALDHTNVLVVLCSPRVMESSYVCDEIRYFKRNGKTDFVYAAVIDGEPSSQSVETGQCFPDPLQYEVDASGQILPDQVLEPLASDFRLPDGSQGWTSPEAYRQALAREEPSFSQKEIEERVSIYTDRLELAKLKLISGILGVPLGILQKRDKAYQLKLEKRRVRIFRRVAAAMAVLLGAAVLSGVGFFLQKQEAEAERRPALRESGKYWLQKAKLAEAYPAKQIFAAKAIAFTGYGRVKDPDDVFWKEVPDQRLDPQLDLQEHEEARDILEKAEGLPHLNPPTLIWSSPLRVHHSDRVTSVAFSPDGSQIASGSEDKTIKLWEAASGKLLHTIDGQSGWISSVAFSPDGSQIASSGGFTIKVWEAGSGKQLNSWMAHSVTIYSVAFSPDGNRIVSGSGDKTIKVWEAGSGRLLQTLEHLDYVRSVAFSPDGSQIVSGSGDKTIKVWDGGSGKLLYTLKGHSGDVRSVTFGPNGKKIVSGSGDKLIRLWEPYSGKFRHAAEGHFGSVNCIAFSPDGSQIASGSTDNTIRLWEAGSGRLLRPLEGHSGSVLSLAYSPDGSQIVSGSGDKTIKVWEAGSGRLLQTLEHLDYVRSVAYSPDGSQIVSGSGDKTIKVWEAGSGRLLQTLEHLDYVRSVAFSPDGKKIAAGSRDRNIRLWEAGSGKLLHTIEGHSSSVWSVAFSPDGSQIVSGSEDKTIKLWEADSGKVLQTLEGHSDHVRSVAFSPDGSQIISGSTDKTIKLWEASSGELLQTLEGHSSSVRSAAFSPDGSQIASSSVDNTIKLWSVGTSKLLDTLEGHSSSVWSVGFSPDGSQIVSGSDDKSIKVWETESGKLLHVLEGHESSVNSVAFSPDGTQIVSGSGDVFRSRDSNNTIKLWDSGSGGLLNTLEGHSKSVLSVAFSPDGSQIASGSVDKTIKLWEAGSGRLLHTLEGSWTLSLAFSPDGKKIAAGMQDKTIKVWEAESGRLLQTLLGHLGSVKSVAFSPDGTKIVSGSEDTTIKLWGADSGKLLHTIEGHSSGVWSVAFSPVGTQIVSSGSYADKTIKLWETESGKLLRTFVVGHSWWGPRQPQTPQQIPTPLKANAAFSPDGCLIVSGSYDDKTIKLWDAKNLQHDQQWIDLSVYLREEKGKWNYWSQIGIDGELTWSPPSDNLFRANQFSFVNVAPNSLLGRTRLAQSENAKALIRARHHFDRRLWKPFWLNWLKLSEQDRVGMTPAIAPAFAQLAAGPPPGYPPGWFENKFLKLRKEFPGADKLDLPEYASGFVRGAVNRPKDLDNSAIESIARNLLESLPESPASQVWRAKLSYRMGDLNSANRILRVLTSENDPMHTTRLVNACFDSGVAGRVDEAQWLLTVADAAVGNIEDAEHRQWIQSIERIRKLNPVPRKWEPSVGLSSLLAKLAQAQWLGDQREAGVATFRKTQKKFATEPEIKGNYFLSKTEKETLLAILAEMEKGEDKEQK